ncbi:MAG: lysophospholipase [Clostridiales bacterium]|nr:lysophospholipase [Clostridiales bacterium]
MKILFFGDSITDMGRNRESPNSVWGYGNGYVAQVAGELLLENPTGYQLVNRGISGNRVVDLYARIKADVWNEQPDVLSILIGVNDIWHEINYQNGVELDRFQRVYRTMLAETKERIPNVKLMLLEPFVLKGSATEARFNEFTEVYEYAKAVKEIAKEFGATFVPLQEKLTAASEKFGVEPYLYDGVHPHIAGAKLIAEEWLSAFEKI